MRLAQTESLKKLANQFKERSEDHRLLITELQNQLTENEFG